MTNFDARNIGGERQQILAEIGGQRLRMLVIYQAFQQCVADTVYRAAQHLAVHDLGIDGTAAVVHDPVAAQRDVSRPYIDLGFDDVAPVLVSRALRREIRRVLQSGRHAAGQAVAR